MLPIPDLTRPARPYAGADWLELSLGVSCSPLGRVVADLLGDAFRGIHRLNHRSLETATWGHPAFVGLVVHGPLSTGGDGLARLVLLAAMRRIRVEFWGAGPGALRLRFTASDGNPGGRSTTLSEGVRSPSDTPTLSQRERGPERLSQGERGKVEAGDAAL